MIISITMTVAITSTVAMMRFVTMDELDGVCVQVRIGEENPCMGLSSSSVNFATRSYPLLSPSVGWVDVGAPSILGMKASPCWAALSGQSEARGRRSTGLSDDQAITRIARVSCPLFASA